MTQPISVLVDGDNISGKHAVQILAIAAQHGQPTVVRAYVDAQHLADWQGANGYRLFHAGAGKNATDILLALDAMELLLSRNIRRFLIASSDSDFTHLALRLREHGATIIGVGEAKAPHAFRACCTHFIEIGQPRAVQLVPKHETKANEFDQKIRAMILTHSENGAGLPITALNSKMRLQHGVQISSYPEKNWRAYLAARPALYDLDPRGAAALVRLRARGFAKAA